VSPLLLSAETCRNPLAHGRPSLEQWHRRRYPDGVRCGAPGWGSRGRRVSAWSAGHVNKPLPRRVKSGRQELNLRLVPRRCPSD
jgi:hypothetical protein